MQKSCSRCKLVKPLEQFFNNRAQRDGKDNFCKSCRSASNDANPKRLEYARRAGANYRARHPDRVKEKSRREYWRDPVAAKARSAEWVRANREAASARVRRHYVKNRAAILLKVRERFIRDYPKNKAVIAARTVAWQRANPEKVRAKTRRFYERNTAKVALQTRRYCANKNMATPAWANTFFMNEAYDLARLRTKLTGIKWDVDHIVPLNSKIVCGLHSHTNLQVIPQRANAVKSNKVWPDMPGAEHGV